MRLIILGSLLVLTIASCKQILAKSFGIKQPSLEDAHSLRAFLNTYELDSAEILTFKASSSFIDHLKTKPGIPEAYFFNKDKQLVNYKSPESSCNANVGLFMEQINQIDVLKSNDQVHLDSILEKIVYADSKIPYTLEAYTEPDAFVIVYWAKYLGKLNETKVLDWEQKWKSIDSSEFNLKFIKINMDYQKNWGVTEEDVMKFEF